MRLVAKCLIPLGNKKIFTAKDFYSQVMIKALSALIY